MKQLKFNQVTQISTWMVILALALAACTPVTETPATPVTETSATPVTETSTTPVTETSATPMTLPSATAMSPELSSATVLLSSNASLGSFLVDSKGLTLYTYTKDTPGVSNCSGDCLTNWPALVSQGNLVAGSDVTGKLGEITRSDGAMQVTYNDMPLYYFSGDTNPGDTTGQGKDDVWFVAPPT